MKRAIVVGASSGIGLEVARLLKKQGWTVGVAARRIDKLAEFEHSARIDVNDQEAGQKLLALIEAVGGMQLYFHASGIGKQNSELNEDIELNTVETNGMGFTRMVGTAFRYLKAIRKPSFFLRYIPRFASGRVLRKRIETSLSYIDVSNISSSANTHSSRIRLLSEEDRKGH